jgi:uncharacterized protein (TIGR03435 family)
MPRICFVLSVLVAATLVVTTPAHAQRFSEIPLARPGQEDAQVSFAVATVKESPAPAGPPKMAINPSGAFTAVNVTLLQLILVAYDVRAYQVVGGPEWMGSQFFDIAAEAPDDFALEDTKAMMRRLLEKRFGLAARKERRPLSVYALKWLDARRRGGPWLRRPSGCDRSPADPPEIMVGPRRRAPSSEGQSTSNSDSECRSFWGFAGVRQGYRNGWFHARRSELSSLVGFLDLEVGKPVFDETGLRGAWDVDLKWDPRRALSDTPGVSDDIPFGSIFMAVREQLGLKLEPTDADVEALVIESAQRPTLN